MLRSSCNNRVSSEFFLDSPDSPSLSSNQHGSETVLLHKQLLPIYNPLSRAAEKERSHLRSAENAVHIIPFNQGVEDRYQNQEYFLCTGQLDSKIEGVKSFNSTNQVAYT
ncbi:Gamma-glutamyl phosphate reductase [Gossypium australe]|uniref:Gamma-glutamyl phosphate reductase n=1 Tax=Gossypium australe TaxID=47621 RepID=A0A5B6ULB1_9ROSI|nr:Gamma-glutamyl phosphate reductase [Gossypium australe]